MKRNGLVGGFVSIISILVLSLTSVHATVDNFKLYEEDLKEYIDLKNCNLVDKTIYKVCWDRTNKRANSGWAIIDPDKMDKVNLNKRPNFYADKNISTMKPNQIGLPFHKGHTFAKDEDFDYNIDDLKLTYNMINITPMYSSVNIGIWRKIENRGRELALKIGPILSITLVEYDSGSRFGFSEGLYPTLFTRIYIGEDIEECYQSKNDMTETNNLNNHKIDCEKIKLK